MKTNSSSAFDPYFPTCGEILKAIVIHGDLHLLPKALKIGDIDPKTTSDLLNDWADETQIPERKAMMGLIDSWTDNTPEGCRLAQIWRQALGQALLEHAELINDIHTFDDKPASVAWFWKLYAPRALSSMASTWIALRHHFGNEAALFQKEFVSVLEELKQLTENRPYPLTLSLLEHYVPELMSDNETNLTKLEASSMDRKTLREWRKGLTLPELASLGEYFSNSPNQTHRINLPAIVYSFSFARMLERLWRNLASLTNIPLDAEFAVLLIAQTKYLSEYEVSIEEFVKCHPKCSWEDKQTNIRKIWLRFEKIAQQAILCGFHGRPWPNADHPVKRIGFCHEYGRYLASKPLNQGSLNFLWEQKELMEAISLRSLKLHSENKALREKLRELRSSHTKHCQQLTALMNCMDARLALAEPSKPAADRLQEAVSLYIRAFDASRYHAGQYTKEIALEALGLITLLWRSDLGELAQLSLKPIINHILSWWDLMDLGEELEHKDEERRIELAARHFHENLNPDLAASLSAEFPGLKQTGWSFFETFRAGEADHVNKLISIPINTRQKIPFTDTVMGRDQSPIIEAISRGQTKVVKKLVRGGSNLNFINSNGDTVITYAFSVKDYDLILEILRRKKDPITNDTLLQNTNQNHRNAVEWAIADGRPEILNELATLGPGNRQPIDMNKRIACGSYPLYYAVSIISYYEMSTLELNQKANLLLPNTKANKAVFGLFAANQINSRRPLIHEELHRHFKKCDYNKKGVQKCISLLIKLGVNVDQPNTNEFSALLFAAERGLKDIMLQLLKAKANPNHQAIGGVAPLCFAIEHDDIEMAKMLLEYGANDRLLIQCKGCRINALPMSEGMRTLIPIQ